MADDITPDQSHEEPEVPWYTQRSAGGPAWQDDGSAHEHRTEWYPTFDPGPVGAPHATTATDDRPSRRERRRRGERGHRPRFGLAALLVALIAGGGAGAGTAALLSNGSSATAAPAASVIASPTAATNNTSSAQSLISKVEPALVDIHTTGTSTSTEPAFGNGANPFGGSGTSTTEAAGTGMIIRSDGLVLTNAHVLEGADTITVELNGSSKTYQASLVGEDAAKDIALIKVAGVSNLPTVTLGDSSQVRSGDSVLAIGNALDLQAGGFTASEGIISGLNRSIETDNSESLSGLLQTTAAISSGDSGGALVDSAGQVVGMNTAAAGSSSSNTASNIGFAIPSNEISGLISQLEKGSIGQTTTGSNGSSSSSSSSASSGSDGSTGSDGGYGSYGSDGSSGYGGYGSFGGSFGSYGSGGYGSALG